MTNALKNINNHVQPTLGNAVISFISLVHWVPNLLVFVSGRYLHPVNKTPGVGIGWGVRGETIVVRQMAGGVEEGRVFSEFAGLVGCTRVTGKYSAFPVHGCVRADGVVERVLEKFPALFLKRTK